VQSSLAEVWRTLWANTTFRHLLACLSIFFFFNYGIFAWQPVFFIRSHGLATGEVGTWLAIAIGLAGPLGSYLGGSLASRYAVGNERLQMQGTAIALCLAGIPLTLAYLTTGPFMAFGLIGINVMLLMMVNGPMFSTIQTLVPEEMRAISFALVYLFANFIGMGLGPLAVGALSDGLRPWAGEDSLRYALVALAPGFLLSAWQAWRASETVARDLGHAQLENEFVRNQADGEPNGSAKRALHGLTPGVE
jgi:MFS family permease